MSVAESLPKSCPYCDCTTYTDAVDGDWISRHFECGVYLPQFDDHTPNASQEVWRRHVMLAKQQQV